MIQNISAASIRKPIPAIILFILLTFAGMLGFSKLGINQFPDVDIPFVTVTVSDAGAAPAELETQVTRIVENSVATVGDVAHITSTVSDGVSVTTVEFVFGKDIDRAVNDVRDAVTRIRSDLPGSITEPVISRSTTSGGPMFTYTVKAPGRSAAEISWFIDNEISKTLLTVPGVGQVKRVGGVEREVLVTLRPERLASYGITAAEISRQLKAINTDVPGGKATVGRMEQSIRTLGSAQSVESLRDMQITLKDGRVVRLSDLGSVEDAANEPSQDAYVDGERSARPRCTSRARSRRPSPGCRPRIPRTRCGASTRRSTSRSSPTTPRSRRCGWARCSRWWWCSGSCATGARP
jgi:HAE1 family hydrophobic/amphiphilic exporter-1